MTADDHEYLKVQHHPPGGEKHVCRLCRRCGHFGCQPAEECDR